MVKRSNDLIETSSRVFEYILENVFESNRKDDGSLKAVKETLLSYAVKIWVESGWDPSFEETLSRISFLFESEDQSPEFYALMRRLASKSTTNFKGSFLQLIPQEFKDLNCFLLEICCQFSEMNDENVYLIVQNLTFLLQRIDEEEIELRRLLSLYRFKALEHDEYMSQDAILEVLDEGDSLSMELFPSLEMYLPYPRIKLLRMALAVEKQKRAQRHTPKRALPILLTLTKIFLKSGDIQGLVDLYPEMVSVSQGPAMIENMTDITCLIVMHFEMMQMFRRLAQTDFSNVARGKVVSFNKIGSSAVPQHINLYFFLSK